MDPNEFDNTSFQFFAYPLTHCTSIQEPKIRHYRPGFDITIGILTLSKPWFLQKTKPTSPQKVRRKLFPNRNENTGRHEPTVSHFAWFYHARKYQARALNQVVNKDEENIVRRS